jgi:capsular polysaccharide biosynthesis protein
MDLFSIVGLIWRHKVATIPVILLTLIGLFYVLEVKPPTYQSTAKVLLSDPPGPPTAAQIAADPALGKINANNPYVNYGNLDLVADVVIDLVNAPVTQQTLVNEGANPKYTVALENAFDNPPVIQVTGTASNGPEAIKSAQLVAQAISQSLYQMQANQHVNSRYMISSDEIVKPTTASASSSGKLRTLVGFVALGIILLLVVVSIAQSLENRRRGRGATTPTADRRPDLSSRNFSDPMQNRNEEVPRRSQSPRMPNADSRMSDTRPRGAVAGYRGRFGDD